MWRRLDKQWACQALPCAGGEIAAARGFAAFAAGASLSGTRLAVIGPSDHHAPRPINDKGDNVKHPFRRLGALAALPDLGERGRAAHEGDRAVPGLQEVLDGDPAARAGAYSPADART